MRLGTAVAVLAFVATAEAGPKKKVRIESDPEGATVYFNSKEDGPVCTTPCTVDAPVGDTPIIVELENHKQLFENLVVSSKKQTTVKYKLLPAIGTIKVKGPAGARIVIDDEDKGKAPATIEVPAGSHAVVLTLDDKKVATEFVDVASNDEVVVEGKAVASAKPKVEEDEPEEETTEPTSTTSDVSTSTSTSVTKERTRAPYIALSLAMDVGFRSFEYENPDSMNLPPEKEGGQVLVGPVVEFWPFTLAKVHALRGLSLLVRFGYGVNSQAVKQSMMNTSAKTFWRAFEASVRHRWNLSSVGLEVGAGFARDQYQFEGMVQDIDLVPDADYKTVRIGAKAALRLGTFEPYFGIENRIVLSGGTIEKRFDSASANGVRAVLGAEAKLGAVSLRLEGALNYYVWTFEYESSMDTFRASGGTDSVKYISAAIGYAY
jgi:hypothetical protein